MKKVLYFILVLVMLFIGCTSEKNKWEKAKASNTIESYKKFIDNYPKSQFYENALYAIDSINIKIADSTNTWQAYQQFIDSFPNSKYIEYAKNKLAQEWWSIKVLNSTLKKSESIGYGACQITVTPEPGKAIAKIDLEVIALHGEIGRLRERLLPEESFITLNLIDYLSGKIPDNAGIWCDFHKPADVSKIETQLFLSKNVTLIINESSIIPQFAQIDGYGTTMTDNGQFSFRQMPGEDYNPQEHFVVYFLRSKMLAAWFQPNKKIAITLYYSVPNDLDNVKIQFYKLPSILINLKKQ